MQLRGGKGTRATWCKIHDTKLRTMAYGLYTVWSMTNGDVRELLSSGKLDKFATSSFLCIVTRPTKESCEILI